MESYFCSECGRATESHLTIEHEVELEDVTSTLCLLCADSLGIVQLSDGALQEFMLMRLHEDMSPEELDSWYEQHVGYSPLSEGMTDAGLRELVASYRKAMNS